MTRTRRGSATDRPHKFYKRLCKTFNETTILDQRVIDHQLGVRPTRPHDAKPFDTKTTIWQQLLIGARPKAFHPSITSCEFNPTTPMKLNFSTLSGHQDKCYSLPDRPRVLWFYWFYTPLEGDCIQPYISHNTRTSTHLLFLWCEYKNYMEAPSIS